MFIKNGSRKNNCDKSHAYHRSDQTKKGINTLNLNKNKEMINNKNKINSLLSDKINEKKISKLKIKDGDGYAYILQLKKEKEDLNYVPYVNDNKTENNPILASNMIGNPNIHLNARGEINKDIQHYENSIINSKSDHILTPSTNYKSNSST